MGKTTIPDYPRGLTFDEVWAGIQELKKTQEETFKSMKESSDRLDKQLGELGNRFGELAEHLVGPSIMEKFNEQGFNFTGRSRNVEVFFPDDPKTYAEVDILLENDDIVIAVEVKATPKEKDVEKHQKRMEILRKKADLRKDKRLYRGAIAGAIMDTEICDYILQNGFYLIEQTGDTVRLTIHEGFVPREW